MKSKLGAARAAVLGIVSLIAFGSANAALIGGTLQDATNCTTPTDCEFFANITIEDVASATPSAVKVSIDVSGNVNGGLQQGDLLAIFFDVTDVNALGGINAFNGLVDTSTGNRLAVLSLGVTVAPSGSPGIDTLPGQGQRVNGTQLLFDFGVGLGTNGAAAGFITKLSFEMSSTAGLSTGLFTGQSIGLRVQSISPTFACDEEPITGCSSSKLVGTATMNAVPSPGTLALLGAGLFGFALVRRRDLTAN